jgi:hypothetical protein
MMLRKLFRPTKVGRYTPVLIIGVLALFILNNSAKAQDSTRLERYGYVIGASLAYSLFDYVGWSLERNDNFRTTSLYRILEGTVQAAITYFLYKECGLSSAISFTLLWWTWVDDLAYYGWANVLNPHWPPWENRTVTGLMGNGVTWAGWTPIGLLRKQGSVIDKYALIAQAIVGFSISMPILW